MPRVQPKSMTKDELYGFLDEFWTMIASLETKDEVKNFFRDLLSETEALMLARRIRIAKMLLRGMGYDEITEKLHASDSTIASVHRWLQSGFGGYAHNLPRLEKELEKKLKKRRPKSGFQEPYSFPWLKKRYPTHFLLFNIFDSLTTPKKLRK